MNDLTPEQLAEREELREELGELVRASDADLVTYGKRSQ